MLLRISASAFVFILFDGFWIRLGLLYPFGFGVGSRIGFFFWAELLIGFWAGQIRVGLQNGAYGLI